MDSDTNTPITPFINVDNTPTSVKILRLLGIINLSLTLLILLVGFLIVTISGIFVSRVADKAESTATSILSGAEDLLKGPDLPDFDPWSDYDSHASHASHELDKSQLPSPIIVNENGTYTLVEGATKFFDDNANRTRISYLGYAWDIWKVNGVLEARPDNKIL